MPQAFIPSAPAVALKKFTFAGTVFEPGTIFPHAELGRSPAGKAIPLTDFELKGLWLADLIAFDPSLMAAGKAKAKGKTKGGKFPEVDPDEIEPDPEQAEA